MKERLLHECADKYERINREYDRHKRRLESLDRLQKDLMTDIVVQIIMLIICVVIISILEPFKEYIHIWFFPFFCIAIWGMKIATVVWNGYQLFRKIKRLIHHRRKIAIDYPKPEIIRSMHSSPPQPNFYAKIKCIEWLLGRYREELECMDKLKSRIEEGEESDYDRFQMELNEIVIYESIGMAKK